MKTDADRRLERKTKWIDRLGGKCQRCGNNDLRVLQIIGGLERYGVAGKRYSIGQVNPDNIRDVAKYRLLCANCHLIEEYERTHG